MTKKLLFTAFSLLLPFAGLNATQAGSAQEKLQNFFQNVQSMKAEFSQSIVSQNNSKKEKSSGVLQMQRPGKFRWDYSFPYQQQIVADGKKLFVYDIEMEQVIVKPLDLVLGNTPAVLLSGNADIADKFEISEIAGEHNGEKGLFWMQLTPKQEESGFEKLLLAFMGDKLRVMQLKDAFGQVTKIEFSNMVLNPNISPLVFEFTVPPGVDVIDDSAAESQ